MIDKHQIIYIFINIDLLTTSIKVSIFSFCSISNTFFKHSDYPNIVRHFIYMSILRNYTQMYDITFLELNIIFILPIILNYHELFNKFISLYFNFGILFFYKPFLQQVFFYVKKKFKKMK